MYTEMVDSGTKNKRSCSDTEASAMSFTVRHVSTMEIQEKRHTKATHTGNLHNNNIKIIDRDTEIHY